MSVASDRSATSDRMIDRTVWQRVLRANERGEPEGSIALRAAVAVAACASAHAALREGVTDGRIGAIVLAALPLAHLFSHLTRHWNGLWLKLFIAVGLVSSVSQFVSQLAQIHGNAAAIQAPLAELFLLTMTLHAWDLPARRDLGFALVSSIVLMAAAGALSVSSAYALDLIVWIAAAAAAVVLLHRRELAELPVPVPLPTRSAASAASAPGSPRSTRSTRSLRAHLRTSLNIVAVIAAVAVIGALAFAFLPQAGGARAFTFPLSLPDADRTPIPGGLVNPTLGAEEPTTVSGQSVSPASSRNGRATFGYFGFANKLDTATRGRPDDTLVMRVRASAPAFWRGQSFDRWDGQAWTSTLPPAIALRGRAPITLPPTAHGPLKEDRFVQTYYIVKPGPNMIFAAPSASEVYFADSTIYRMEDGSLRAGVLLDAGAVYTVVSRQADVNEASLAVTSASGVPARLQPTAGLSPNEIRRYLQLPPTTSARTRTLARDMTAQADSTFAKVRAIEAWMAANTQYSLNIGPLPSGADAVDHFLFDEREGFCEQIGTSLVVLLRSLGIPARLTVGYVPGERNPFSGLYEVRASDAHSWAEVWFPAMGWVPFDPTANVPLAPGEGSSRAGTGALAYLNAHLPDLPPWCEPAALVLAGVLVAVALVVAVRRGAARRRARHNRPWVERWVERLDDVGRRRGQPRLATQSVRAYTASLGLGTDDLWQSVVGVIEQEAFGDGTSHEDRAVADFVLASLDSHARPDHGFGVKNVAVTTMDDAKTTETCTAAGVTP